MCEIVSLIEVGRERVSRDGSDENSIKKAKKTGMGAVSLINPTQCSALSYYGLLIAEQKIAGIAFTNSMRDTTARLIDKYAKDSSMALV